MSGVWGLSGQRHHHVNVLMDHQQPHCTSLQNFQGILTDVSVRALKGRFMCTKKHRKRKPTREIIISFWGKTASAYTKPNLEIFADDVKASHGATVGQLDEEQLFYLKTRGNLRCRGTQAFVAGFGRDILDAIPDVNRTPRGAQATWIMKTYKIIEKIFLIFATLLSRRSILIRQRRLKSPTRLFKLFQIFTLIVMALESRSLYPCQRSD